MGIVEYMFGNPKAELRNVRSRYELDKDTEADRHALQAIANARHNDQIRQIIAGKQTKELLGELIYWQRESVATRHAIENIRYRCGWIVGLLLVIIGMLLLMLAA